MIQQHQFSSSLLQHILCTSKSPSIQKLKDSLRTQMILVTQNIFKSLILLLYIGFIFLKDFMGSLKSYEYPRPRIVQEKKPYLWIAIRCCVEVFVLNLWFHKYTIKILFMYLFYSIIHTQMVVSWNHVCYY